jgi:hypothetical protein
MSDFIIGIAGAVVLWLLGLYLLPDNVNQEEDE